MEITEEYKGKKEEQANETNEGAEGMIHWLNEWMNEWMRK